MFYTDLILFSQEGLFWLWGMDQVFEEKNGRLKNKGYKGYFMCKIGRF